MNYRDLVEFRDNVAIPRMMEVFEKTEIPNGACYINELEISFLDGRNCGFENNIKAAGLVYSNGKVDEYLYDECDISVNDFLLDHKDCVFMSDGSLRIVDELEELDLSTKIRCAGKCKQFFPQLKDMNEFKTEFISEVFAKMEYLLHDQKSLEKMGRESKASLADQIESASSRVSGSSSGKSEQDLCF